MFEKTGNFYIFMGMAALLLVTLACGSVQVGVVTPTPQGGPEPVRGDQETVPTPTPEVTSEVEPVEDSTTAMDEAGSPEIAVVAWLGHIASLPAGSQFDDFVLLSPQGTGEFGLTGANEEIEAEIRSLRDTGGSQEYVHLWGSLSCLGQDYNGCQLVVDRLQYGAKNSEEPVSGWVGTIIGSTFNSGDSYVFQLAGDFPMWYSIYASQDESLQAEIENQRDTGSIVSVDGRLIVGVPDVNGTRIEISHLTLLESGTIPQPTRPAAIQDLTADWPVFLNDRYDYQVKYPPNATLSFHGPVGFPSDELPADKSADEYMSDLLKLYTDKLCVQIEYPLGWIYISAPANAGARYNPCGPTGIGSGEVISLTESVYIGERLYRANGQEVKLALMDASGNLVSGERLDMHYDMFMVELEDGTRIRWGSSPDGEATYQDYRMKTRDVLLQILATYQDLP